MSRKAEINVMKLRNAVNLIAECFHEVDEKVDRVVETNDTLNKENDALREQIRLLMWFKNEVENTLNHWGESVTSDDKKGILTHNEKRIRKALQALSDDLEEIVGESDGVV